MTPDHSDKQTPRARAGDQPTIPSIVIELHIGRLPEAPAKVENCLRDDTIASFPSYEVSEDRRSLNGATEISTPFPNRPDSPFPHHAYKLFFPIARGVQALIGDSFKIRELAKFNILKPLTTNLELYVSLDPIDQKGEKSKLACDGSLITDD
ncbi:MAG: hypothetical protein KDD53_07570, partial [Bdellovibrionales bacterium]|nr:hypothetical protein [Bdellovibrionales bacterium]